ncbi:MAG: Fe-S cluster assembly ATPase SufC [Thiotrichales bacterium]|nr:MAG: Fe-S cluster assembly ATPase SufC [Thiotrichales bacterium]
MLQINNLHAEVAGKQILKDFNLQIKPGEVHAIMGPNGTGKSTLGNVLAGNDKYLVTKGSVTFCEQDLLALSPEARAHLGIFLAFQYPVEIPGVNNMYFLRTAFNSLRKQRNEKPLDAMDFISTLKEKLSLVGLASSFLERGVNEGFSGGEKKRNEILQMLLLEPKLAILDETDSGLDIDALQIVAKAVNHLRNKDRSFLIITHYQRLLQHIVPDYVHVLHNGKIVKTGGKELALELEEKGYAWLE